MALRNLKILDFSTLLPGPYASLMLADMGADIIRISNPNRDDLVMASEPYIGDTGISANQAWLNRNKKTMFLDLKKQESTEIIKRLIVDEGYDIILQQFRPGVMERLGLGYDDLKDLTPKLIYCSLTGFGQTGVYKNRASHDINYMALSGTVSHSGRKVTGPPPLGMQVGDFAVGSMHSIIGILMAVEHRHNTGEGQYIDVSIFDGMASVNSIDGCGFLVSGKRPKREEEPYNGGSLYDYYETSDGKYMSIAALEDKFWKKFCLAIDRPDWQKDGLTFISENSSASSLEERKDELKDIIKSKTRAQWEEVFGDLDVCVEPVLDVEELLLENQHVKDRKLVIDMDVEGETVKQYAMPIHFSKTKPKYVHAGKKLGIDTENIVRSLGYSDDEYNELIDKGIFGSK